MNLRGLYRRKVVSFLFFILRFIFRLHAFLLLVLNYNIMGENMITYENIIKIMFRK